MFYDVLMEKRAQREEKKKSLDYGTASVGAAGAIGAGKGLVLLADRSDRVRDLISGKEYYEQLAKMSPIERDMFRARGRALVGSAAAGGLLSTYLANKYLNTEE